MLVFWFWDAVELIIIRHACPDQLFCISEMLEWSIWDKKLYVFYICGQTFYVQCISMPCIVYYKIWILYNDPGCMMRFVAMQSCSSTTYNTHQMDTTANSILSHMPVSTRPLSIGLHKCFFLVYYLWQQVYTSKHVWVDTKVSILPSWISSEVVCYTTPPPPVCKLHYTNQSLKCLPCTHGGVDLYM